MTALSRVESRRLAELRAEEAIVDAGIDSFHTVSAALIRIRDGELYRADGHTSFDAYLRAKTHWRFGRSHAYRLIDAAAVADDLSPNGGRPNERQARELAPLDADARREVWTQATAGGQTPTAARIAELARIAGLPEEEQQRAVADSEARILAAEHGEARQVGGEDRRGRLEQIGRLLLRLRKLIEGLGEESAPALRLLGAVSAALHALPG